MNSRTAQISSKRAYDRQHGVVLTRNKVVAFMLDISGYAPDNNLSEIRVLDPAAGEGAFALECIKRLHHSSVAFQFDFVKSLQNLTFVEQDKRIRDKLISNLDAKLKHLGVANSERVASSLSLFEDYLLTDLGPFDLVVGNPPYVRHELIPEEKKILYRARFHTFRYRSDLYIAFLEHGLRSLSTAGILCFICSDRWMWNKYGQALRRLISSRYNVRLIVNLNDADAFDERVSGYPAIILISRETAKKTKYGQITDISQLKDVAAAYQTGRSRAFKLVESSTNTEDPWVFDDALLAVLNSNLLTIEQQGFCIGIGVATGCDRVFIGPKLKDVVESELLLPVVTTKDIVNGSIRWHGEYLLNPFDDGNTQLVDLTEYPRLNAYLLSNEQAIKRRHVAKKNPVNWYRTIDRIYPDLVNQPKLLIADIRKRQLIALDKGNYYPHHNIYYITHKKVEYLKILGSLLMSSFVFKQLKGVSVTMRGGYSRWQSQNLRKLKIPLIDSIQAIKKHQLVASFEAKDLKTIDGLVSDILR